MEQILMSLWICRSILEFAAPVWNGAITNVEKQDIERTQKGDLHIILGDQYVDYKKWKTTLQQIKKWKTTSKMKTEDDLNFY